MDLEIAGNTAVVTASSSGLGKASAKALSMEGVDVVINGRDGDRLDTAVEEVAEVGTAEVIGYQGDLTVKQDITELIETAVTEFGGLDHLVTSAGGPPSGPFLEITEDDWYEAYELLVMSVVRAVHESVSYLRSSEFGTIVNITSMSVKEASENLVLSNSVRMGVIGLEKTLSMELAPDIRANAILPGAHETARTVELVTQGVERGQYEDYDSGLEKRYSDIPLGIGDPLNVGKTAAYLSSPASGNITGGAIPVHGGSGSSTL
jgi:NAD(P)-dependent dehydrogenase (short-subunit alcohol dehydrogenase family)